MHAAPSFLIAFLGLLQLAAGVYAFYVSNSPTHELLAAILLGFGTLCIALAIVLRNLIRLQQTAERHLANSDRLCQRLEELHETAQSQLAIFARLKVRAPER